MRTVSFYAVHRCVYYTQRNYLVTDEKVWLVRRNVNFLKVNVKHWKVSFSTNKFLSCLTILKTLGKFRESTKKFWQNNRVILVWVWNSQTTTLPKQLVYRTALPIAVLLESLGSCFWCNSVFRNRKFLGLVFLYKQ